MAILKRDDILQAPDITKELVPVPEWGKDGEVYVKGLTGEEYDKFQGSLVKMNGSNRSINYVNFSAKLVSLSVCDEEGKRLFNEGDVQALAKKSALPISRIVAVARRLSGIGDEEVEELTMGMQDPFDSSPSA